jgi:hypothetical protein
MNGARECSATVGTAWLWLMWWIVRTVELVDGRTSASQPFSALCIAGAVIAAVL